MEVISEIPKTTASESGPELSDDVGDAINFDAVVVLASGENRRDMARQLVRAGVSDNLVLSVTPKMVDETVAGALPKLTPAQVEGANDMALTELEGSSGWLEQCDTDYFNYSVSCISPKPLTTEGEAIEFTKLAEERGWDSVVVVTERSHLNRSLVIFDRCFPGEVVGAESSIRGPWYRDLGRSIYEVAALTKLGLFSAC